MFSFFRQTKNTRETSIDIYMNEHQYHISEDLCMIFTANNNNYTLYYSFAPPLNWTAHHPIILLRKIAESEASS